MSEDAVTYASAEQHRDALIRELRKKSEQLHDTQHMRDLLTERVFCLEREVERLRRVEVAATELRRAWRAKMGVCDGPGTVRVSKAESALVKALTADNDSGAGAAVEPPGGGE